MAYKPKIVSTAPLAEQLVGKIRSAGLEYDLQACISIHYRSGSSLAAQVQALDTAMVLFTSANAVHAVAALLGNNRPLNWKVGCLQGSTRAALEQYWPGIEVIATGVDSAALAAELLQRAPGQYTFFCGGLRMDTLPALLNESASSVTELVVYDTVLLEPALDYVPDAVLFFSPSGVQSYTARNPLEQVPRLVCIGSSTAASIPETGKKHVHVANHPSKEAVVDTLLTLF